MRLALPSGVPRLGEMTFRTILISLAACVGLTALAAWIFDWPLGKAVALAPVVVIVAGATAFLFVLWTKIVLESIRGRRGGSKPGV
jgi:hypothetical protein